MNFDHELLPKPSRDREQLKADLDEAGYCLVADALSPEQVARLRARLRELEAAEKKGAGDRAFTLVDNLLAKGKLFRDLILNEPVDEIIAYLLGEDYLLSLFEGRAVGPGHGAQALHSDQNFVPCRTPVPFIANALWMLVDFTERNGATRIVPGSHVWDERHPIIAKDNATWATFSRLMDELYDLEPAQADSQLRRGARGMLNANPEGTVAAAAPAGTALVIDARVIHGAGMNVTADERRWTILTYYCRPFMRQHTNPFLSLSEEALRELPAAVRRRLGVRPWTLLGRYEGDIGWAVPGSIPGEARGAAWVRG